MLRCCQCLRIPPASVTPPTDARMCDRHVECRSKAAVSAPAGIARADGVCTLRATVTLRDGERLIGCDLSNANSVTLVRPGSAADRAGLVVGDLIVSVDGETLGTRRVKDVLLSKRSHDFTLTRDVGALRRADAAPASARGQWSDRGPLDAAPATSSPLGLPLTDRSAAAGTRAHAHLASSLSPFSDRSRTTSAGAPRASAHSAGAADDRKQPL